MREQRQQTSQKLNCFNSLLHLLYMYLHSTYCFYIGIYTIRIILLYLEYAYNAVVVMQYVTKMEEPYNSLTYVRVFRVLNIAKSFDQYYKMFIAKETFKVV